MRKLAFGLACALGLGCLGLALADESLPPLRLGSGQTATQEANGQTVQVAAAGIQATVYFDEISAQRVMGHAVRTSGGTSSGSVTVTWVNRGQYVVVRLSAVAPDQSFAMEGGETDKRTGDQQASP